MTRPPHRWLFALVTTLSIQGQAIDYSHDVVFKRETPAAYDVGLVISEETFQPDVLRRTFEAFYEDFGNRYRLLRITIARDALSLLAVTSSSYSGYTNPRGFDGWRNFDAAQLISIDGNAIVSIRKGSTITHIQLAGSGDPRLIASDPTPVRLVSFLLNGAASGDVFYLQAKRLPTLDKAEDLVEILRSFRPAGRVVLVIRRESTFGLEGGPKVDVFFDPFPDIPEDQIRQSQYIYCGPQPSGPPDSCSFKQAGPR